MMLGRTVVIISILLLILSGCSTLQHSQQGTFVEGLTAMDSQVMADDVARQLARIYPPAGTTFSLQPALHDAFGLALVKQLRNTGFAIHEQQPDIAQQPDWIVRPESAFKTASKPRSGLALNYILDRHDNLYRVLVRINDEQLTRAYLAQADKVLPAGEWTQRK